MSLSCDHLVRDLGNVGASSGVVAAFRSVLLEGWLVALADGQRVRVVEHVCLAQTRLSVVHVVDSHVRLGQPLSLNVHTLLSVIFQHHVLAHQVSDASHLLVLEGSGVCARHSHSASLKQCG